MSGESKMLNTETSLMTYQHARCMSGEFKMFQNRDRFNELLT